MIGVKRRDEEFAREALTRYLCPPLRRSELVWEPDEAPDWRVRLAGREFGVEVTWVTGTTNVDGKPLPTRQVSASLTSWVESLRVEVEAEPWLKGLYIISMRPIRDLRKQSERLREEIVAYIRRTTHLSEARRHRLPGGWSVGKYRGSSTQLSYCFSVGGGGWKGDIEIEAERLIGTAMRRKESLLRSSSLPIVLALVDDYHFADLGAWKDATKTVVMSEALSVFRVHGEYHCDLLRGKDLREWRVPAN